MHSHYTGEVEDPNRNARLRPNLALRYDNVRAINTVLFRLIDLLVNVLILCCGGYVEGEKLCLPPKAPSIPFLSCKL